MNMPFKKKSSGFTLIELIIVIVIIGVLASATTVFIKFSTLIYTETTARDKLVSSARFAVERLNREIRNALPNSLRLTNNGVCLEFIPIISSAIYTDIPVFPDSKREIITVIKRDDSLSNYNGLNAIVYPLTADDVYPDIASDEDSVHGIKSIVTTGNKWTITLNNEVVFAKHSPTNRIYFVENNSQVSYCVLNNTLTRNGILMAHDIKNTYTAFEVIEATLQRNAMVQIQLQFEKNDEHITFNNEVQVLNVP